MDENMKTPLFLDESTTIEDECIELVMQDSLDLVQQLSTSKKLPNSSKALLGYKRYGPVHEIEMFVSLFLLLF